MAASSPTAIEVLLAKREWVRRLARTLARDEAAAEDLEQEVWLAAAQRPPADVSTPRAWLATVLRRRLGRERRSASRLARRERAAARSEATASTLDVVEKAEWHERVVRAVLDLAEPYRTTLLLRWFDDLPPREVAARMDVPVETVRSRAQRGLVLLRTRFDEEHRGERRAWSLPLLAYASGTRPSLIGVAAMTTGAKVALGAGAAVVGGALVLLLRAEPAPVAQPVEQAGHGEIAASSDGPRLAASPRGPSAPLEAAAPAPSVLAGRLRVVEVPAESGAGIAGADVVLLDDSAARHALTTDAEGFAPLLPRGSVRIVSGWAHAAGHALTHVGSLDLSQGARVALDKVADLNVRFTVDGTEVSAEEARRRVGEELRVLWMRDDAFTDTGASSFFRLWLDPPETWRMEGRIDLSGDAPRVSPQPGAQAWWIAVLRPGDQAWVERLDLTGSREVVVPLRAQDQRVRLRAVDADTGAPIAGATAVPYAEVGDDRAFVPGQPVVTDARGEWEVPVPLPARKGMRNATWWVSTDDRLASVPPHLLQSAGRSTLDVRLLRTATIRGRAFRPNGTPAVGHIVSANRKGRDVRTTVGPDGAFLLRGAPAERGSVRLMLVGDIARAEVTMRDVEVQPGAEVVVDFGAPAGTRPMGTVTGRITAGGRPLPGVTVMVGKKGGTLATSDADGRWRAEGLPVGEVPMAVLLGEVGVADDFVLVTEKPLRVDASGETVADVDLPGGAIRVRVLDDVTGAAVPKAHVLAYVNDTSSVRDLFPGWIYQPGWCATADATGSVVLPGLAVRGAHRVVAVRSTDLAEGQADAVVAGTWDSPTDVTVRIRRKEGK